MKVEYENYLTAVNHIHHKVEWKIRQINPSALCSITRELEHLDLIKPKRLRLGLNNDHNQVGSLEVVSSQTRLL